MNTILLLIHLFTMPGGFYAPSALDTVTEHPSIVCPIIIEFQGGK